MGLAHFIFVSLNFRILGRLYGRLNKRFPGKVDNLWNAQSTIDKLEIVLGPAIFTRRAMLFHVSVVRPADLPTFILGDDEVADLIFRLNRRWNAKLYRWLAQLAGY